MSSWTSSESRVISGRVEYFCKRSRQLTVQTVKTRKNPGKRFVTCSKCNVYDFLDDDLPSEYYKELLYEMLQKQKQLKKGVDYEQVINVLAMDKSMLEEELRATNSKLKLYDRCNVFYVMVKSNMYDLYAQMVRYLLQMQVAKQMQATNACCKCLLKMLTANACCQAKQIQLQMLVANATANAVNAIACNKANAYCKCLLQMQ
ncbi:hypothetical protein Tco_0481570 [Tanacetum coccineum]